jgi:hypothetical protein
VREGPCSLPHPESSVSPNEIAGFHRCANLHGCLRPSWESPPPEGATIPVVRNRLRSPHDRAGFHRCANLHDAYSFVGIAAARGRDDPRGCQEQVTFPT